MVLGVLGCMFGHLGDPPGSGFAALIGGAGGLVLGVLLGGLWRPRPAPAVPPPGRPCDRCQARAILHATDARGGSVVGEVHLCEQHARHFLASEHPAAPPVRLPQRQAEGILAAHAVAGTSASPQGSAGRQAGEVEVEIVRVIVIDTSALQVVLLREVDGKRRLTLTVNVFTADMVAMRLGKQFSPWPLTHDGWAACIAALGGRAREVVFNDLRDEAYRAQIRLIQGERLASADIPASDALVLALACDVPILVAERLLAGS